MSINMKDKKKEYSIVGVLWEDHTRFTDTELPPTEDISEYIRPSLTFGLLYKETDKYIILVQHIERFDDHDGTDYFIILKGTILSIKEYGKINIYKLRKKGA